MRKIGQSPGSWKVVHDRIPPAIAEALYARVLGLSVKDQSPVNIARQLSASYSFNLSPGTVRHWIVGDRRLQRRNVFRQEPSPALSYIIGANIGDGCTLTANWIVKLEVTDHDFAETFNNCMAKLFSRVSPNKILVRRSVGRLPMYTVKYSSKQLAKLLRLSLKKLLEIALAFPHEFLRGFFDAEGYVNVTITKYLKLSVGVENSAKSLLLRVRKLLQELNMTSRLDRKREAGSIKVIRSKSFVMKRTSYSVVISRVDDVKRFAKEIGFSINRKVQKLDDALFVIGACKAKSRPARWKQLYSKVRGEWVRRDLSSLRSSKSIKE